MIPFNKQNLRFRLPKKGFLNFKSNRGVRFRRSFVILKTFQLLLIGERCSPWLVLPAPETTPSQPHAKDATYPLKGQYLK